MTSNTKDLMLGPLCTWIKTFHNEGGFGGKSLDYGQLCDGVFLHEVMLQIDPRPPHRGVCHTGGDVNTRIRNLDILVRNVKAFYEDVLGQLIVIRLPDVVLVGRDPQSDNAVEELQKLLLLILGCAVQCDKKEDIIENIKRLDVGVQHSIVQCIQQVTDNPETVWIQEWAQLNLIQDEQQETMFRLLVRNLKSLVKERDDLWHNITEVILEKDGEVSANLVKSSSTRFSSGSEKHHYGVELADCKGKVRRLRQELEEKTEALAECKEEVELTKDKFNKLKQENLALVQDARAAKTYRDELDILKERANKVDKLEAEIQKYKDKMNEMDFYKSRIEELREDNRILIETKEMLEDQLENSRRKAELVPELENEILRLKSKVNELSLERDADRDRIQDLVEENAQLQMSTKHSMTESANLLAELDHLRNQASPGLGDSLCDQLNKDAHGKLLKLELENQRLLSIIEHLRDGSFHEHSEKILELEKENKRLSMKVEQLQEANKRETQHSLELEQMQQELSRESSKLQDVLEMVRVSSDRQQVELEREKGQLVDLVNSLRQRNEKSNDARIKDIESENRKLMESNQEMKGHISQLQFEKEKLDKLAEKLQLTSDKLIELENNKLQIEKENSDLHHAIAAFKQTCDKFEMLEQENLELQSEIRRLNKKMENLQSTCSRVEKLEQDNIYLNIENQRFMKNVEILKSSSQKILDLEQEKQEIQHANNLLRKNVEALKIDRAKHEQMEMDLLSANTDNQRLQKSLETTSKKVDEIEQENQLLENENQKLQKTIETYKVSTRKLNDLERENTDFEAENHKLERERTSMEKEISRLKQAAEMKGQMIDEFSSKVSLLERENKRLTKELENRNVCADRVSEFEKENRDLVQQSAIDKKTLATLREDLVSEKIKTQQLVNELEKLTSELQKIGLNKEKLMATEQAQDEDRYKALESMIEEALKKSLEIKEEKIHALDSRLQESVNRNSELREQLRTVKRQYEALKQRHEEEVRNNSESIHRPQEIDIQCKKSTKQIHDLKEQLNESEKMNASVVEENRNLKSQLSSAREQVSALHSQVTSLQHQATSLTEHNSVLQSQNARLQVEVSTLQSQNSLLTSQNTAMQGQKSSLETSKEQLLKKQEEIQLAHESLVCDHEALQKLHEQLSSEYESLLNEMGSLKSVQKNLKAEYKAVVEKCQGLLASQDNVLQMKQSLETDREHLRSDSKSLNNLRAEHSKLKDDFRLLHTTNEHLKVEYKTLQSEYKNIKTEFNTTKLKNMELQGDLAECRDQVSSLDVEVHKLTSKNEMLANVNTTLRDERHTLVSQVSCLLTQYHELLTQALEDKEHFHEKEKNNMDKVNQLERQKAQLETKIMEQFMRMENYSPKKKGFGANLVRKVRRAGSELINKVPRGSRVAKDGDRKGENSDTATTDNQDNSSVGSGSFGPDSPDGGNEASNNKASQELYQEDSTDTGDQIERRGSMRRIRQSKPNSVFYTKVPTTDDQSPTTRGSISSEELTSFQADSHGSSGHLGDVDSCTSSGVQEVTPQASTKSKCETDELCADRLILGTPGTRRAVYYNDEHDTVPTRDVGLREESSKLSSPSVGRKYSRHPDRVSIHVSSISPDLHTRSPSMRSTTSEYVISSASSSPATPHRVTGKLPSTHREWDKSRDQFLSLLELSKGSPASSSSRRDSTSIAVTDSVPPSQNPSPKQASWDGENGKTTTVNGSSPIGGRVYASYASSQSTLVGGSDRGNDSPCVSRPLSTLEGSHQTQESFDQGSPSATRSPVSNLLSNRSSPILLSPRASAMLGQASKVVSQPATNKLSPDKSCAPPTPGTGSELPSENGRTVDNSIWYEYGCV